jgi:uncharacterized protein (DUF1501 family)
MKYSTTFEHISHMTNMTHPPLALAASATSLPRRQWLKTLGAGLLIPSVGSVSPHVWAQAPSAAMQSSAASRQAWASNRMVVVLLRGAYDGLSAFVPYADPNYMRLRPDIGVAAPDGTAQTALQLDAQFAMHPAMSALMPLWQQGMLSFVPASGSPHPTRSHFEAQYHWETAAPGQNKGVDGWLNKLASLQSSSPASSQRTSNTGQPLIAAPSLIGVGESNPHILLGSASTKMLAKGQAATRTGVMGNAASRQALLDLYKGQDKLSESFRQGSASRLQTAQDLSAPVSDLSMSTGMHPEGMSAEMKAANNGAANVQGLALDAQQLARLMRQEPQLRLGFLSAGGWDTHANQGNATGQLANNLASLSNALVELRRYFSAPGDVIVVASEFGRTCAQNGTRGTDHGHGNAMWLLGERVNGGRWHGEWTGLANGNLNQGRDLPVHHDFRAVLAQVMRRHFALSDSVLADVLPGLQWDKQLDGLMRA